MRLLFILLFSFFTLHSFAQEPAWGTQAKNDSLDAREKRAVQKFLTVLDRWLIVDFARQGLIINTLVKTSPFLQYPAMNPELGAYLSTFERETGSTVILRAYIDIDYFNPWVAIYRGSQKTRKAFEINKAKPAHAVIDIAYSPTGMKSKYEVAGYNITVRDSLRTPAFREIFGEEDFIRMRDTLQAAMGSGPVQGVDSAGFNAAVIRALEALKGDPKTKPDPGYKVTFRKGEAKGYDAYRYPALRKHYHTDNAGSPVPWLSISIRDALTLQGRYEVKDTEAAKETLINIEASDLTAGGPQVKDTILTQALRPAGETREVDITANYFRTNRFGKGTETIAGQVALAIYKEKEMNLVVVLPADSRNNIPQVDAKKLESYLDEVYRPALVSWKVRTETLDYDYPATLEVDSERAKYSAGMNAMIKAFKKQKDVESKTCYVFLVPGLSGGATGFMPFKGQCAFVTSSGDIFHTIAHELGHGPFRLRHTFSQEGYVAGQGTTDNLMDYTTGNKTILYKHQWDLVHDPETMLFAGREDAEEGKHMVVYLKDIPDNYRNPDKTITFFTPALLPITLPADVSSVIFSTSDEVSSESGGIKYLTPIGSLLKFSAGNEQYTFRGTDIHFFGYFNEKDSAYADRFTKKLTETGGYGLIAYPFYENGQTGYKLIKAALNPNSNEIKAAFALSSYQGQGIVNKNVASLLDQISSSGQAIVVPQGASIHAPILPPLSNTALEFLQRNSTLTKGDQWTAPLFIAHAHQISQRPIYENCLNDFWQNLDNDLKMLSDRKHSQDNVHVTSEQQFQKASDPSSFTGLFEDYNRWKKDIEKYRDYEKLVIAINKEIQEQNTPEKMLAWFRKNLTDAVDCLYDEIELSSRLKAIELLAQGSGSIFSDCPEYVNRLMETTVRNGQSNALYHAFRDKNNKLFLLLWNNTYLSDKARFVQNLSTIVTAYNPIDDIYCLPKTIVTTGKTEIANTTCFSFFYKQEALGLDQKASYSASIYQGKVILNGFFDNILFEKSEYDPFTMMKFTFPKGNCMSLGDDINPVTGAEFYAPAFYGAWLVNEVNKQKNREELAKGFRILLDGAVIVITGGSSATVRAALEVAFSGTDIIIQLNADDLKQTKEGVEYLNTWNELYITGGIGLGITYVPDLIEGAARSFSRIVVKEAGFVDSYRNMSPLLRDKFLNVFRLTGDILKKTKQLTASNIQTSNFIYKLAEINFSAKVSQIAKDVSTKVKNDLLTSIIYLNMEYDIAAFAFQGEQAYLKLAGSWGLKTGNVLMRMEEVAYTVPNSVRIEHGSIELVLNEGTKMFGWRVVPSNMALSRYANYTELTAWIKTGTLDTRLMDRLSTMSDDLLAGLEQSITFNRNLSSHFKTNPDHLDDWVMLFSKRYGGKAGNLRKSPMSVVLDPDALTALHSIRNTTQTVKQKLGITDDILAGMYTGKNDSYADLMSDMAALTKNLESNPTTGFANFNRVRDNLLLKGDADLITVNRRQGAHGVIKALNREVNLWKGGKIKFEEQVQNARNTLSSVDAQVEAIIEAESRTFRVEIKYCMDCVDASVIKIQLIERDMHVSRNIGEIKWWVIGQKITREDFAGWMVANREAINGLELSVKQRYFKNIRFESDIITDIDIRTFANQNFESIFN